MVCGSKATLNLNCFPDVYRSSSRSTFPVVSSLSPLLSKCPLQLYLYVVNASTRDLTRFSKCPPQFIIVSSNLQLTIPVFKLISSLHHSFHSISSVHSKCRHTFQVYTSLSTLHFKCPPSPRFICSFQVTTQVFVLLSNRPSQFELLFP